jgi:hypothetical protein
MEMSCNILFRTKYGILTADEDTNCAVPPVMMKECCVELQVRSKRGGHGMGSQTRTVLGKASSWQCVLPLSQNDSTACSHDVTIVMTVNWVKDHFTKYGWAKVRPPMLSCSLMTDR